MKTILKNTLILIILALFFLCSCEQNVVSINEEPKPTTSIKCEDNAISPTSDETEAKKISELIKSFYSAIENQNSKDLAKISDKEGIVLIRTFMSGFGTRGQEFREDIIPSEFPENLTFHVQGEEPIELKISFKVDKKDYSNIKVYDTDESLDWDSLIKPDILKTFGKLIENEKELDIGTRIYKLKGDSFCLAQFSGSGLQYSSWAVFEKKDKEYFLKIVALVY